MTNIRYHGKVYLSKGSGRLFTVTPNGNVLYKHPVYGPFVWTPASKHWTPESLAFHAKSGYLVEVNEK